MRSKLLIPLILVCTLLSADGAQAAPPHTHSHGHAPHAIQYRSIELHLGTHAPDDPAAERRMHPGGRLWKPPGGMSAYLVPAMVVDGDEIRSVQASDTDTPAVDLELTASGAAKLRTLTDGNLGKALGVVLDGELLSVSTIGAAFGAQLRISAISPEHAKSLVDDLRAGATD